MRRPSWKRLLLVGTGSGVLGLVVLGGAAYALTDVPQPSAQAVSQATILTYADGSELGRIGAQNRRLVDLKDVSDPAQKAVLAAEDRGFYTEPGISPKGIARALFTNVRGGGDIQQGGSTITQQYAKNAFLTSERTYTRKLKEVLISLKMTQTRSKDQILEDYLNTIYFGRGAYGIEAAAETYFGGPSGQSARRLSVAQAAVLAASIRSPAAYDPSKHKDRAVGRWNYVLDGMVKQGWLTPEERAAQKYPNVRSVTASAQEDRKGPKGYVIDRVEDEMASLGREAQVAAGGLIIQTTLRRDAQEAAEQQMSEQIPEGAGGTGQDAIQGALVAVKPGTGEVYAYYGGRNGNGGFDYASHDHPQDPGSTMKPYVLAAALDKGIGLGTRFNGNSPRTFTGYPTPVSNFGGEDWGTIDLVDATAHSVNTVYVALAKEVGPDAVAEAAHRAGIGEDVKLAGPDGHPALGIALGIYGVPVIDQATGFATFAANGVSAQPFMVKTVRDARTRKVVYTAKAKTARAFSEGVAADATYAMQQVVRRGTASTNGRLADGRPAAGKTGTTQDSNDAWMVGFTPQLATAVWIGRGNNKPIVGELGSSGGLTGGTAPARIWKAFMDAALQGQPEEDFPPRAYVGSRARVDDGGSSSGDDTSGTTRRRRDRSPGPGDQAPEPDQSSAVVVEPTRRATEAPRTAAPAPTREPDPPRTQEPQPTPPPAEPPAPTPPPSG